jgi:hypothetical protein
VRLSWKAKDDIAVDRYQVDKYWWYIEGDGETIYDRDTIYSGSRPSAKVDRPIAPEPTNHYGDLGYIVRAYDSSGNYTEKIIDPMWTACFDEDGASHGYFDQPFLKRQTTGTWGTSRCLCWMGDTTMRTYDPGASVSYTASYTPYVDVLGPGLGVVMAMGPDRGKASITINGRYVATVDTYSVKRKHRMVAYYARTFREGDTITVTNLGTPGHSRIDVDALVTFSNVP